MADLTQIGDYFIGQLGNTTSGEEELRLAKKISAAATSISTNFEPLDQDGAAITQNFFIALTNSDGATEVMRVTAVSGTTLTVVRGMARGGIDFAGSSDNAVTHGAGQVVVCSVYAGITQMMVDSLQGDIGSGKKYNAVPTYMGAGIHRNRVFATAAARNAAITSPANGDECYLTDTGEYYDYTAGSWIARVAGGTFPNGSITVAGKFEEATVAEQGTAAATGGTGARLLPANANLVKTSSGAGDANKIAILGATGKFATGFLTDLTGLYGDGSDGAVTISADTTLTRDMYYSALTINITKTLKCGGFRIFVAGTLTNNGTIGATGAAGGDGGDGGDAIPNDPGAAGAAGTGSSALTSGSIYGTIGNAAGGIGKIGASGANHGVAGTNGTAGTAEAVSITNDNGVAGGAGGDGGDEGSGTYNGGTAGTASSGGTATQSNVIPRDLGSAINMLELAGTVSQLHGAATSGTGASGGSGAGNGIAGDGGGSGGGGASGDNGGLLGVYAEIIVNTGSIGADGGAGGDGGDGGAGGDEVNGGGGGGAGGGGGGGNGGVIAMVYNTLTDTGSITVSGGAGGTGGTGGTGGAGTNPGDPGLVGSAGAAGSAGLVIQIPTLI